MDIIQHLPCIFGDSHMIARLPDRSPIQYGRKSHLVQSHYSADTFRFRYRQKKVTMIRHDDEAEQKKRVKLLNLIQMFDCGIGQSLVGKNWHTITAIRCNEHWQTVLIGMSL